MRIFPLMQDAETFDIAVVTGREAIAGIGPRLAIDLDPRWTRDDDGAEMGGMGNTCRRHIADADGAVCCSGAGKLPQPLSGKPRRSAVDHETVAPEDSSNERQPA